MAGKKIRASAKFPSASATIVPLTDPEATARRIVQALKARDAFSLHLSVALDAIVEQLGLREHWSLFHSAMEEANRRNWVHFRGNSHCVLTADGQAADLD